MMGSCEPIARGAEAWYNRAMTEEVGTPLLATKLYIPPVQRDQVERARLLERLDVSPEGLVYHGSERYLGGPDTPVRSAATE